MSRITALYVLRNTTLSHFIVEQAGRMYVNAFVGARRSTRFSFARTICVKAPIGALMLR